MKARELEAVCREITEVLVGAPVQKVVQPERWAVLLGMRTAWLHLSADPRVGRLHLVDDKGPGTGEAAPPFCMLLRKELIGARLSACTAVAGERACELSFLRAGEPRRLRLYLFGKSAQLVLTDGEGKPLGALGPAREIRTELPPPREPAGEDRFGDHPSRRIAAHYAAESERLQRADAETQAEAQRRAERKKLERLEAALAGDLEKARAAAERRKWGDLLFAHLAEVPRGASSVTLADDFADGAPVTIPLLPDRSPSENAQKHYAEHKRLTRAAAKIAARLDEVRRKRAALEALPLDVAAVAARLAQPAKKRRRDEKTPPYREFKSGRGAPILVGRGADRNDELTFQVARGSDLWLHARDVPGAHVVVPLASSRAVDEETLVDAATLAAHHSNARGEPQVDVTYTLRKHVRKPPRVRAGTVTLSEQKTIRVRIEPDRLARLLASRVD